MQFARLRSVFIQRLRECHSPPSDKLTTTSSLGNVSVEPMYLRILQAGVTASKTISVGAAVRSTFDGWRSMQSDVVVDTQLYGLSPIAPHLCHSTEY